MKNGDAAASGYETASYVIAGVGLLLVIKLHLLPALLAGFLVYELVHTLAPILRGTRLGGVRAKIVAVAILASAIITLLGLGIKRKMRTGNDCRKYRQICRSLFRIENYKEI